MNQDQINSLIAAANSILADKIKYLYSFIKSNNLSQAIWPITQLYNKLKKEEVPAYDVRRCLKNIKKHLEQFPVALVVLNELLSLISISGLIGPLPL